MDNELAEKFTASFFKVEVSKLGKVAVRRSVEEVVAEGFRGRGQNNQQCHKCIKEMKPSVDFKKTDRLKGSK